MERFRRALFLAAGCAAGIVLVIWYFNVRDFEARQMIAGISIACALIVGYLFLFEDRHFEKATLGKLLIYLFLGLIPLGALLIVGFVGVLHHAHKMEKKDDHICEVNR